MSYANLVYIIGAILCVYQIAGDQVLDIDTDILRSWHPSQNWSSVLEYEMHKFPPALVNQTGELIVWKLKTFGREFNLKLRRIDKLNLSSDEFELFENVTNKKCVYYFAEGNTEVVLNKCNGPKLKGVLTLADGVGLEVRSMNSTLKQKYNVTGDMHMVLKRITPQPEVTPPDTNKTNNPTIELAVFLEFEAYKLYSKFYNNNDTKLRQLIMDYLNGAQSLFYHPSLKHKIDLDIVRLELWHEQPAGIKNHNNYSENLLRQFCDYQKSINPGNDSDPGHWDLALFLTAIDFYSIPAKNVKRDIAGMASGESMCTPTACAMVKMGTPGMGIQYTSFLAHEIAHTMGVRHDSDLNNCTVNSKAIMSTGKYMWSNCSSYYVAHFLPKLPCLFDKRMGSTFKDNFPGRRWTVNQQCQVYLRNKAVIHSFASPAISCDQFQCMFRSNVTKYWSAGPALDGTYCGLSKWCQYGECVTKLPEFQNEIERAHNAQFSH